MFLAQRYPVERVAAIIVLLWGICLILTPTCTSYHGLFVQRFFLGALESGVSPMFMMIIGSWYRKNEQAFRIGMWYSLTGYTATFSPLINYGLGHIEGKLNAWTYMYFFAGGEFFLFLFLLPFFGDFFSGDEMRWDETRREEKRRKKTLWLTHTHHDFFRRHHDIMVHRHILLPRPRSRPSQILLLSRQIHFSRSTTNQQLGRTKHQMEKRPSHGIINRSEILASFLDGMSCNGNVLPLEIPPFLPPPLFLLLSIYFPAMACFSLLILLLQQKRSATAPSPPSCPSSSPDSASVPSTRSSSRCPQEPTAAPSCS